MAIALPKSLHRLITNIPLRGVLVVPFVLQTVGAVILVGYLSYQSGQESVADLRHRLVAETNKRVTQELKTYLQTPLLINRLNVDAVNQGQIDLQNIPDLEAALFNRLQQFDQVSAILFVNPQGRLRAVEGLPTVRLNVADPDRPDKILVYRLDSQGRRGKLIDTLNDADVRRDSWRDRFTNRPWYQRAITTGQLGWNPLFQHGSSNALTLNASQPVYDRDTKQLLGVFSVHIWLNYLSELLQRLDISRFGRVIITDQSGALIATSIQEKPYKILGGTGLHPQLQQLKMDESQDDLTRSLGKYLRDRPDILTLDQPQYLEFRHNSDLQSVQITPFQDHYGLNWQIVTVIPKLHFMATLQNNTRTTVLLCLLTLGAAIALGLLATNQLTARFTQLNRVSQELAAGNLDQRLPTDTLIYELNSLAATFNQMSDQLQQSFDHIKTALAESEEKFTIIFRSSPDLITLTTLAEGRCVEANDSFFEVLEYSREQLIGQRLLNLGIWGNLGDRIRFRQALQQDGSVRNLEVQSRTQTGQIKTILVSAELVEINGETYVLGIGRDISDRVRLEADRQQATAALRQSEALNRTILNALPDLIIRMHRDGTYLDFKTTHVFPLEFPNLSKGENIRNILPADTAQQRLAAATAALQTGEIQVYEFPLSVQGQHLWQEARVMPLDTDEVLVVIRDLTQRHQMEADLSHSEARLAIAQRVAQVGHWEWELESNTRTWSQDTFHHWGLEPTQPEPNFTELVQRVHPGDRAGWQQIVEEAIQTGNPYAFDLRVIHPDGSMRYLESRGEPMLNTQGKVFKLIGTSLDITDRKQAEAALQASETRFRQLAETVEEGFFVYEIESAHYSYVNPAYEAIIGTSLQSMHPGMAHWLNNIYPDDRDRVEASLHQEVQGGNFDQEYRYIRPDGEMRWLRSQAFPLKNEAETIVRVVGTVEDISDRKQTEAALQESEARFQEIAQTIHQVVYVISVTTGQYLYISPSYEKLWGYSCESLYQNPESWLNRIHPEDSEYVLRGFNQLLAGKQARLQYRIIGANGEVHWIESESLVVYDDNGNPLRVVGLADDITDRQKTEEALRDSEERFRRAFDDAPIGISLISLTGRFLRANAYYCNLVGYTEEELLTLTFQEMTHPADLEKDSEGLRQMLVGEIRSFQMEKRYITKQGEIVPVLMSTAPIRDPEGQPLYFVGHIQDIRDRLKVERMKNEFVSVVSHELRTPLTSIRGALGILESGVFNDRPEKAQHMLQIALNNSDRLVRLVNDILDLERLESDKVQLVMEPCQVADLMQQAIDSVQAIADQSTVILCFTPLATPLIAAPNAIIQTLTNLLSNAIKFSDPGNTVWLKAELGKREEDTELERRKAKVTPNSVRVASPKELLRTPNALSSSILFSITDQGRGIPAEKLELIFEQFQQVDVSDSREKGGTGLGLAICKNIVQQHGGQIWAESTLGKGSTFYFTLPVV
jgi:PAS domain S-box-containing protein